MELVGGVSAGWLRWVVAVDGFAVMGVGGGAGVVEDGDGLRL